MNYLQKVKEKLEEILIPANLFFEFNRNEDRERRQSEVKTKIKVPEVNAKNKRKKEHKPRTPLKEYCKDKLNTLKKYIKKKKAKEHVAEDVADSLIVNDRDTLNLDYEQYLKKKPTKFLAFINLFHDLNENNSYNFELKTWQFYALLIFYECNMSEVKNLIKYFIDFGTVLGLIILISITLITEMPLIMFIMSMSSYAKKLYINFFQSMPLLIGIPFCLLMSNLLNQVRWYYNGAANIIFANLMLFRDNWLNCRFVTNKPDCVTIYGTLKKYTCNKNTTIATTYYYRYITTKVETGSPNNQLKILVLVFALLIYILSLIRLKKILNLYILLNLTTMAIFFTFSLIFLILRFNDVNMLMIKLRFRKKYKDIPFFMHLFTSTVKPHLYPLLIWISVMKPASVDPQTATVIMCTARILFIIVVGSHYAIVVSIIYTDYAFQTWDCLNFGSSDMMQNLIPDIIWRTRYVSSTIYVWMFCTFYTWLINNILSVCIYSDGIIEAMQLKKNCRVLVYTAYHVVSLFIVRICFQFNYYHMLRGWVIDGLFLINNFILAFLTFGIYFSYTGNRFNDDFNFVYDYSPNKIWLYLLAPMPYYTSVIAIATLVTEFQSKLRMKYSHNSQIYFIFGTILIILTSIIIISKIVHHLITKQVENITATHRDWGPYNEQLKNLRRLYFSNRDVRRRQIIPSCSHKCLLNSKAYHKMQDRQYKKLIILEALQEEHDFNSEASNNLLNL